MCGYLLLASSRNLLLWLSGDPRMLQSSKQIYKISFNVFLGILKISNPLERNTKVKRSLLEAEEEAATILTKTNMVAKRKVVKGTGCSSATSRMT